MIPMPSIPVRRRAAGPQLCGHGRLWPELPQVRIGGWVRQPAMLDGPALETLGALTVTDFVVRCTVDGAHGGARPMRAVPLAALIERCEPDFAERTDFKRAAIVAASEDGYRALFSWSELFHTPVGAGVLLAFDSPHAPLAPHTAPFALLSLHDTFTGPRFVRKLAAVDLVQIW